MFIELTDYLRCPEEHEEQYLVLLPSRMAERDVRDGELGCPVCNRTIFIADGVLDIGGEPPDAAARGEAASILQPEAMAAFLGLGGPGGYLALVGAPAGQWKALLEVVPGVQPVVINPPAGTPNESPVSVARGGRLPFKSRTMRGVVLGPGYAGDPHWVAEAARVLLPGLRVVGEGPDPAGGALEVAASADGVWVAVRAGR